MEFRLLNSNVNGKLDIKRSETNLGVLFGFALATSVLGLSVTIYLAINSGGDQSEHNKADSNVVAALNVCEHVNAQQEKVSDLDLEGSVQREVSLHHSDVKCSRKRLASDSPKDPTVVYYVAETDVRAMMNVASQFKRPISSNIYIQSVISEMDAEAPPEINPQFFALARFGLKSLPESFPLLSYALPSEDYYGAQVISFSLSSIRPEKRPDNFATETPRYSAKTHRASLDFSSREFSWTNTKERAYLIQRPKERPMRVGSEHSEGVIGQRVSAEPRVFAVVVPGFYEADPQFFRSRSMPRLNTESAGWELLGVFSNGESVWGLLRDRKGQIFSVSKGDVIDGHLLSDIDRHGLEIRNGVLEKRVQVGEDF